MSSSRCDALSATRSRHVPAGTVGGRIAGTWNPWRRSSADAASAASGAPTTIDPIGLTNGRVIVASDGRLRERGVEAIDVAPELDSNRRVVGEDAQALERRRDHGRGERRAKHVPTRARDQETLHLARARDESTVRTDGFAQRSDVHVDVGASTRAPAPRHPPRSPHTNVACASSRINKKPYLRFNDAKRSTSA